GRTAIQTEITGLSTALWVTKGGTPISLGGTNIYYNNGGYPTAGISEVHTVNYYDNYTFDTAGLTIPTGNILNQPVATNIKGLPIGSKVRVLESNPVKWITSITVYDTKGRAIYIASKNEYLETTDVVETLYDFPGKVIESKT